MKTLFDDLREGYIRYRDERLPAYGPLFKNLSDRGQRPKALVIACSDSRVDPAFMFDQNPGDLFVVRNVANVVPPYEPKPGYHGTSAAIEFAVMGLQVTDIIVLGHAQCGGIQALVGMADGDPPAGEFIGPWMSIARPAVSMARHLEDDPSDRFANTEQAVVRLSLENLETFPWVSKRIASGALKMHGFYFDISKGFVKWLNPDTNCFEEFA